jgi:hypothetical protein
VSGKMPSTYIGTAFIIGIIIVVTMVLFLRHQWG